MTMKHFSIVQQGMIPWYNLCNINTMNYKCVSLVFQSDTLTITVLKLVREFCSR